MPPERSVVSKKFVWSAEATEWLLEMWLENLGGFRGKKRKNLDIMKEMAHSMREFNITWVEIKAKMDNMKKRYRNEFLKLKSSGTGRSKWNYFNKMRLLVEDSDEEDDDDDVYDREAERKAKKAFKRMQRPEIHSIKEKSPEINETEVEYPDSLAEYECLEPDSRNRSQTEDYNDSDEDMLSNLYSKPTERTHAENMSDSSMEYDFPESNAKRYKRDRARALGEEMLALQRETLKVLQTISEDLSNFHDKFLRALKPRREKRSRLS
ncbi:uncharacterized protein LOC119553550 [Drosophila subpulchrella]|uniref:uncharacterized protein LOC119553550 n=1 Tax=Drosophila subpulchrella TaxID=1486046 RepID=UPI0018A15FAE|nr:uncharacterized protein LOC119553550 [Drosophila subpulchrella]